ncbi:MAG TPA: metal-dependent hydrolase [Thermoanaerobaculia bacterium]|nr:metal-dependent hydrolase [Thermoanaerobaculia bacterium]
MPTVLTHPAVPLALGAVAGGDRVCGRLLVAGVIASVLPDADVLGFRWGVPYASEFGHRGFSHSLLFAVLLAITAAAAARFLRASRGTAAWFVGLSCASHGLLDMLTNGGKGVAYFWPVSAERFFFPARVIEVSTLNLRRFFSSAGISTLSSELRWIWLPAAVIACAGLVIRRGRTAG